MNEFAQQPARKRAMSMKLSTAVTLMIGSVIGSVLILVYALWFMQISGATRDGVKDTALAVARTLADTPEVKRGLTLPPDSGIIQPLAREMPTPGGAGRHPAQWPAVCRRHQYGRHSLLASQ